MTTPKEALERARAFVSHAPGSNAENTLRMIDEALASLEGDAVERVARMVDPEAFEDDRLTWEDRRVRALNRARRILATGLVAGDAARPLGDVFNELVRRMNFDGMDPRTFTLGELERAIDGAEFPK